MTSASATHPSISVVVPFHNVERYIGTCIESLLSQSYPRDRFEVVCVDNCSTDRSPEIARAFDGVTVLSQPVQGSYAARNMGVRHTRSDIVATIDPDCKPSRDWLSEIASSMSSGTCHIVLGRTYHASPSAMLDLLESYEAEKVEYITDRRDKSLYFGYTNNMAFRRSLFDELGLFPERVRGGDTMFVQRAVNRFGCDVVAFNPHMRATHLELDTVKAYYSKRRIYGGSNERIAHVMPFRPLKNSERWDVFRRLVRKERFTIGKALMLLAVLAPGLLLYESGRRIGKLNPSRRG